ncbi:secreted RxLR effector protein 161-like [Solenopsis invicta]|uniref:secreted RxLR effector protein 161-like n=1 Tax=Solenopsis invicta TaxID=13686 RepID=UPI00193CD1D9|nr:secreted RxLR effector protein 161-like [Solenopsis invicta]
MYLSVGTRPDISYPVSILSKFLEVPLREHWTAAKRILKYLKSTPNLGIVYNRMTSKPNQLIAYSDADYASCLDTRKSTSGVILMLNDGPIIWSSRKHIVATSTTDAEYVAAYDATKEVVWSRQLLKDIGVEQFEPTTLFCDNAATQKLIENPIFHRKSKHVDIKFHYTRELVKQKQIKIQHVSTQSQLADILTKPLARGKFEINPNQLNLM